MAEGPMAFSPDGKLLAAGGSPWTSSAGTVARLVKPVASRDMTSALRLWSVSARTFVMQSESGYGPIVRVAYSADGGFVAAGSHEGVIRVVNRAQAAAPIFPQEPLRHSGDPHLRGHVGAISGLAFSPTARLLVSAGVDGTLRLWDPTDERPLHVIRGHAGPVAAVAFSADGSLVVSAGSDATVRLWDPATGGLAHVLDGQTDRAPVAELSSHGPLLATGGPDGVVRMWQWSAG
jgi:WD40 repeat protein